MISVLTALIFLAETQAIQEALEQKGHSENIKGNRKEEQKAKNFKAEIVIYINRKEKREKYLIIAKGSSVRSAATNFSSALLPDINDMNTSSAQIVVSQ